jgi:hypothetical protein
VNSTTPKAYTDSDIKHFSDALSPAMGLHDHEVQEITPPLSIRNAPPTPPPTDEKLARDVTYILRQISKQRVGVTVQRIYEVNKRVWAAVHSQLLRDDKLRYANFVAV